MTLSLNFLTKSSTAKRLSLCALGSPPCAITSSSCKAFKQRLYKSLSFLHRNISALSSLKQEANLNYCMVLNVYLSLKPCFKAFKNPSTIGLSLDTEQMLS